MGRGMVDGSVEVSEARFSIEVRLVDATDGALNRARRETTESGGSFSYAKSLCRKADELAEAKKAEAKPAAA